MRYEKIDSRRVYSFEPVSSEIAMGKTHHILGVQANFWSHIDRTPDRVVATDLPAPAGSCGTRLVPEGN